MPTARLISIRGDLAYEFYDGGNSTRLIYLTGDAQDRFPLADEHSTHYAKCVLNAAGVDWSFVGDRPQGTRRRLQRSFHDRLNLFLKAHDHIASQHRRRKKLLDSN